jgi:ABC-type uncharacterized transport system permease subunit
MASRAASAAPLTLERPAEAKPLGIAAVAFGVLAFLVALPPVEGRSALWPVLLGVPAVLGGAWTASRGLRRLGYGAIAAGVLGAALGVLATHSSVSKLDTVVVWSALIASMLRYATPLTFAAIGGMFSERSGVVNIGLEGMMLTGAFFGLYGADKTNSWALGILIAMAAGGALALIHAFVSIHLRADQIVSGTAINFLALGVTGYFFVEFYGDNGTPPSSQLPAIPDIGPRFAHLNLMIWLSFVVILASYVVMFRTPLGLRIRSVGEHPRAAETVGISVYATRYLGVTVSGMLAAMGGAYLSVGFVHSFSENMTAGRGFIALAALIFGRWRPFGAFAGALLFGFADALSDRLPVYSSSVAVLFNALPYLVTLVAVAGVIGRSIPPAAIGRPYRKQ